MHEFAHLILALFRAFLGGGIGLGVLLIIGGLIAAPDEQGSAMPISVMGVYGGGILAVIFGLILALTYLF
jgi:hypothetical protein